MVQQLNRICSITAAACLLLVSVRLSPASVGQVLGVPGSQRRTHTLYCLFAFEIVGSQKKR
jgi:hypothetical protein